MNRGGNAGRNQRRLETLLRDLRTADCSIESEKLQEILSFGSLAVPRLEAIIQNVLRKSSKIESNIAPKNTEWFILVHALYLLAHLRSEKSLALVLDFMSQKQQILDYWLHDLLNEDIWEVVYLLGRNQLTTLEEFVLNQENNSFSRLAVCTALVQIALNNTSKQKDVGKIFRKVLKLENEDPDFIGLVVSELMDLLDEGLRPLILNALEENDVWSGIISPEEVNRSYQNKHTRTLAPLDLSERYEYFRQQAYFSKTASGISPKVAKLRKLEKSL